MQITIELYTCKILCKNIYMYCCRFETNQFIFIALCSGLDQERYMSQLML